MNRIEIKKIAKSKIKGNIWNILWPMLVISVLYGILYNIFNLNPYSSIDITNLEAMANVNISVKAEIGSAILGIVFGIIGAGYKKYILNFTRNGKFEINDIINTLKEKWLNILIAVILVTIVVSIGMILFIIPGIILSLALSMAVFLVIDTDISGSDSLKESWDMMKGYKWDYFVFILSFIGWILLIPLTFGLILIWLQPYMTVANTLYYDKLKEITSKK